ncbi:MAG: hypothetical protein AAGH15_07035 [Myxococcota bacterium]
MRALGTPARVLVMALCLASCGDDGPPLTEVVLSINTDLETPFEVDGIRVMVSRMGVDEMMAVGTLGPGQPRLPRTVSLVHEGGRLGPFEARIQLTRGGGVVIERVVRFTFVERASLRLNVILAGACIDIFCSDAEESCGPIGDTNVVGCQSIDVPLQQLDGSASPLRGLDGGV